MNSSKCRNGNWQHCYERHQKIDLILIFDTFLKNLLLEVLHLGTRPTNDEPSLLQNYLFDDDKKTGIFGVIIHFRSAKHLAVLPVFQLK